MRELSPETRVFVAASGAIFGEAPESPQREDTPCRPANPYAIAKLAAHQLVGAMREHEGLHACSGIVYNHESERRPERFVTRRITRGGGRDRARAARGADAGLAARRCATGRSPATSCAAPG